MSVAIDDVVRRLGGVLYDGGRRALVPGPGHSHRDRSLSLWENNDGRLVFFSHAGDAVAAVCGHLGIEAKAESELSARERAKAKRAREEAQQIEKRRKLDFCRRIWETAEGQDVAPALRYLQDGRGIPVRRLPAALRFHGAAPRSYAEDRRSPAMVALVCDPLGQACGLHITYLKADYLAHDGRIMTGATRGGAVRLHAPTDELAVCEGIETGLSYSYLSGLPTWALLSTSQFVTFKPPIEVDKLTIAADSDDKTGASVAMGQAMAERITTATTRLHAAPRGMDWNTALRQGVDA